MPQYVVGKAPVTSSVRVKQTAATCEYKTDINNSNNPQATHAGDADEMVMLQQTAAGYRAINGTLVFTLYSE